MCGRTRAALLRIRPADDLAVPALLRASPWALCINKAGGAAERIHVDDDRGELVPGTGRMGDCARAKRRRGREERGGEGRQGMGREGRVSSCTGLSPDARRRRYNSEPYFSRKVKIALS
jgi:hypothetical protein